MKTILRIIIILLIAAIVAAGFNLAAGSSSQASGSDTNEGRQPPSTSSDDSQFRPRPEGDREGGEGASIGGLVGILGSLAKLTIVGALVLLIQKGYDLITKKKAATAQTA